MGLSSILSGGTNDFVAQLVELLTLNQKVVGSSPTGITKESQVEEVSVRIREVGWSWRYPLRVSILFFLQNIYRSA